MNPQDLKSVLLSESSTEQQREFARMLVEQSALHELQKTHLCWFFIPSQTEYEKMKRFNQPPDYDKCPKCGKGRVVVEIYRGNIGESWHMVCRWGEKDCNFKEYISDAN